MSQVCLYSKFSLTLTSNLAGFEEYHFDEQNDHNENIIVNSGVDSFVPIYSNRLYSNFYCSNFGCGVRL